MALPPAQRARRAMSRRNAVRGRAAGAGMKRLSAAVEGYFAWRAWATAWVKALALAVMVGQSDLVIASLVTMEEPTPRQAAPALIQSAAFLRSTPPVGV